MSWSELAGRATITFIVLAFIIFRVVPFLGFQVWKAEALKMGSVDIVDLNQQYQAARAITEQDRDWMTRTLYVETLGEPREAQVAVANVIKNRWIKSPYTNWKTISQVVSACGFITKKGRKVKVCQFEPWISKAKKKRMSSLKPVSKSYAHFRGIVDEVLDDLVADNVDGRRCFQNVSIVKRRNGIVPRCKDGNCLSFADSQHTFYYCKGWPKI